MDVREVVSGMTVNERQELVVLAAELAELDAVYRRGLDVPQAVGPLALQVVELRLPSDETAARELPPPAGLERFIDAGQRLGLSEQLEVTNSFWDTLGYRVPPLTADQRRHIGAVVDAHPDRRVVPTPLMSFDERRRVAEHTRAFAGSQFHPDYRAIWAPTDTWSYGKLLRDPGVTVIGREGTMGLRYKTPSGAPAGRADYIEQLVAAGQAIRDDNGMVWTFPVMEAGVHSPRTKTSARALHEALPVISSPESILTVNLLHQALGTPNQDWQPDFVNEATYVMDDSGEVIDVSRPVSLVWDAGNQRLGLYSWNAERESAHFGVRATVSGL